MRPGAAPRRRASPGSAARPPSPARTGRRARRADGPPIRHRAPARPPRTHGRSPRARATVRPPVRAGPAKTPIPPRSGAAAASPTGSSPRARPRRGRRHVGRSRSRRSCALRARVAATAAEVATSSASSTAPVSSHYCPAVADRRRPELALAVLLAVIVGGTIGYVVLGFSLLDAVYQTVTTVTTVGFREVSRSRAPARSSRSSSSSWAWARRSTRSCCSWRRCSKASSPNSSGGDAWNAGSVGCEITSCCAAGVGWARRSPVISSARTRSW